MASMRALNEEGASKECLSSAEWSRIPPTGKTLEGFFRSELYGLIRKGLVKSAAIKEPGSLKTGKRLIYIPSLRKYISSHVEVKEEAV